MAHSGQGKIVRLGAQEVLPAAEAVGGIRRLWHRSVRRWVWDRAPGNQLREKRVVGEVALVMGAWDRHGADTAGVG